MKKTWFMIILAVFAIMCSIMALGCKGKNSESTTESTPHTHSPQRVYASSSTCTEEGKISHFYCAGCEKYFADASLRTELSREEVFSAKLPHTPTKTEAKATSCDAMGNIEYWTCSVCNKTFADADCTEEKQKSEFMIEKLEHEIVFKEESLAEGTKDGMKEHYECTVCKKYFLDEQGTEEVELEDLLIETVLGIPDFLVEVPTGREPVILQLSDTQIIDAGQERPGRGGIDRNFWATDKMNERCFNYLREIVDATNPDFIIITGDLVYGEFDDNGTALQKLIAVMESFEIPWSPVFGNHDNESKKGVDWQCAQFEASKYCYFEQKTLSGNGNYSVGIAQGGELLRVFYMMDTNGCGAASAESIANGHTYNGYVGFKQDQIDWYTNQIKLLKEYAPDVNISFAYHIQQSVFGEAYAKYGFNQNEKMQGINLDTMEGVAESDFGYIGRQMKGPWDTSKNVYNAMKQMGVDSIFVGHEHCNNVSVMYDGIRFTYGLKSSEYDRYNWLYSDGTIDGGYGKVANAKSLVGGTVIVLTKGDGDIEDCYNYYCGFENGKVDWSKYKKITVNGLQYGGVNVTTAEMYADGAVTAEAVEFKGENVYAVTANTQGKLFINTALLKGKTTFTFTLYMEEALGTGVLNPFALRVKPDNGSVANLPGGYMDSSNGNKQYIRFRVGEAAAADEVRLEVGTWQTFTVDISGFADVCTEFSFNIYKGNTLYLKDIALS